MDISIGQIALAILLVIGAFGVLWMLYSNLRKVNQQVLRVRDNLQIQVSQSKARIDTADAEIRQLKAEAQNAAATVEGRIAEIAGLKEAVQAITNQFVNDSVRFISSGLTANNYEASRKKLEKAFNLVQANNIEYPKKDEAAFHKRLQDDWKVEVKREAQRQDQQSIKEQMREEAKAERERQQEIERIEKERKVIEAALQKALRENNDQHSAEIEGWRARLAEVEASHQRAVSQAQLTKSGHVYVISNIGSFGENVFKIGMTRRLKPEERIDELGSASVPFPFDVHLMISSDNAPALETKLHQDLTTLRLNKVNNRKEFFRVTLEDIEASVRRHHGKIDYVFEPIAKAHEYRETKLIEERGGSSEYVGSLGDDDELEDKAA